MNEVFPPETIAHVWSYLTIKDLVKYGATSRANYNTVFSAITNTIHRLLLPFAAEHGVLQFLNMLKFEKAVVSGSTALYPMISSNFGGTDSSGTHWHPNDMDLYEPICREENSGVVRYLVSIKGFVEIGKRKHLMAETYGFRPSINRITHLQKGDLFVDVVTASSPCAILPVFGFHSTPVFGWISGDGLFHAYPKMTCEGRGLTNPMTFTLKNFVPPLPPANVRSALEKYFYRGFNIHKNPRCWPEGLGKEHVCTSDVNCPHTARHILDSGTMFLKFARFDDSSGILTPKEVLPYRSPSILYWNLGGPSCDGERRVTESFITLKAEEEEQVVM